MTWRISFKQSTSHLGGSVVIIIRWSFIYKPFHEGNFLAIYGPLRFLWWLVGCHGSLNYPSIFSTGSGRSNLDVFLGEKKHVSEKYLQTPLGGDICRSSIKSMISFGVSEMSNVLWWIFSVCFVFFEMIKITGCAIPFSIDSETVFRSFPTSSTFFCEKNPEKTQHPVGFLECIDRFPFRTSKKKASEKSRKTGKKRWPPQTKPYPLSWSRELAKRFAKCFFWLWQL